MASRLQFHMSPSSARPGIHLQMHSSHATKLQSATTSKTTSVSPRKGFSGFWLDVSSAWFSHFGVPANFRSNLHCLVSNLSAATCCCPSAILAFPYDDVAKRLLYTRFRCQLSIHQNLFRQDSPVSDSPSDITLSHVGGAELVSAQPACHLTKAIITRQLAPTIQQARSPSCKILPSQIRLLISHCHTLAVLNWCPLSRRVILQKRSSRDNWRQPSSKPGLSHARCSRVSDSPSDITLSHVGGAELVSAQPACHLTKAIITRQLAPTIQQARSFPCKMLSCLRFAF